MSQLRIIIFKLAVCIFSLSALLAVFLHSANPKGSLLPTIPWVLVTLFVFSVAVYLTIIIGGTFNQWSINKGAIDTQWLWFQAIPPGLELITHQADITSGL